MSDGNIGEFNTPRKRGRPRKVIQEPAPAGAMRAANLRQTSIPTDGLVNVLQQVVQGLNDIKGLVTQKQIDTQVINQSRVPQNVARRTTPPISEPQNGIHQISRLDLESAESALFPPLTPTGSVPDFNDGAFNFGQADFVNSERFSEDNLRARFGRIDAKLEVLANRFKELFEVIAPIQSYFNSTTKNRIIGA